jgi:hypothetical protein
LISLGYLDTWRSTMANQTLGLSFESLVKFYVA